MKYVYSIEVEKGESEGIAIRVLKKGSIKIASKVPLSFRKLKEREEREIHWLKRKKQQENGKDQTLEATESIEEVEQALEQVENGNLPGKPKEKEVTDNSGDLPSPQNGSNESDEIFPGDKIEIKLNGEPTPAKVYKTFDEDQEIAVQLKGGDKLVIPASQFIRKL